MAQIFPPRVNVIAKLVLLAIPTLLLFAWRGVGYKVMRSPYVTQQNVYVEQPVPFSHEHHVGGLGLDCRYCHTSVETVALRRPAADPYLHDLPLAALDQRGMLAPVRESLARTGRSAGGASTACRTTSISTTASTSPTASAARPATGRSDEMPLMRQAAPLTMGWCLDCHRDPAPNLRPRRPRSSTWPGRRRRTRPSTGAALRAAYHIDTEHLTDCSVCHR